MADSVRVDEDLGPGDGEVICEESTQSIILELPDDIMDAVNAAHDNIQIQVDPSSQGDDNNIVLQLIIEPPASMNEAELATETCEGTESAVDDAPNENEGNDSFDQVPLEPSADESVDENTSDDEEDEMDEIPPEPTTEQCGGIPVNDILQAAASEIGLQCEDSNGEFAEDGHSESDVKEDMMADEEDQKPQSLSNEPEENDTSDQLAEETENPVEPSNKENETPVNGATDQEGSIAIVSTEEPPVLMENSSVKADNSTNEDLESPMDTTDAPCEGKLTSMQPVKEQPSSVLTENGTAEEKAPVEENQIPVVPRTEAEEVHTQSMPDQPPIVATASPSIAEEKAATSQNETEPSSVPSEESDIPVEPPLPSSQPSEATKASVTPDVMDEADESWEDEFPMQISETLTVSCSICRKEYTLEGKDRFVDARTYTCPICMSRKEKKMRLHKLLFTRGSESPDRTGSGTASPAGGAVAAKERIPCPDCGKGFRTRKDLSRHMRIHTGEKPHKCNICGKAFAQSSSMHRHVLTHSALKPHKCEVCGLTFRGHLARHMRSHTGEKPFQCEICLKGFFRSEHLRKHLNTHIKDGSMNWTSGKIEEIFKRCTTLQIFKCDVCDKTYTNSGHLARHQLSHNGERLYACVKCKKRFTRREHLKRHVATAHNLNAEGVKGHDDGDLHSDSAYDDLIDFTSLSNKHGAEEDEEEEDGERGKEEVDGRKEEDKGVHDPESSATNVANGVYVPQNDEEEACEQEMGKGEHSVPEHKCEHNSVTCGLCGVTCCCPHSLTFHLDAHCSVPTCNTCGEDIEDDLLEEEGCTKCRACANRSEKVQRLDSIIRNRVSAASTPTKETDVDGGMEEADNPMHLLANCADAADKPHTLLHEKGAIGNATGDEKSVPAALRKCHLCGKIFKGGHLERHLRSHAKGKPFQCSECPKSFVLMAQLRAHQRAHKATFSAPTPPPAPARKRRGRPRKVRPYAFPNGGMEDATVNHAPKEYRRQTEESFLHQLNMVATNPVVKMKHLHLESLTHQHQEPKQHPEPGPHDCTEDRVNCGLCGYACCCSKFIAMHMETHTIRMLTCHNCGTAVQVTQDELSGGQFAEDGSDFLCEICRVRGEKKMRLSQVLQGRVIRTRRVFPKNRNRCPHCFKTFRLPHDLRDHITETHATDSDPSSDPNSDLNGDLNDYSDTITGVVRVYQCTLCEGKFCTARQLGRHMHTHQPSVCKVCGKSISGHMSRHMRTHTEERPYKCEFCMRGFHRPEHLKRHMDTHQGGNRVRPYKCGVCEKEFQRKYHLKRHHVQTHSKEELRERNIVFDTTQELHPDRASDNEEADESSPSVPRRLQSIKSSLKRSLDSMRDNTGGKKNEGGTVLQQLTERDTKPVMTLDTPILQKFGAELAQNIKDAKPHSGQAAEGQMATSGELPMGEPQSNGRLTTGGQKDESGEMADSGQEDEDAVDHECTHVAASCELCGQTYCCIDELLMHLETHAMIDVHCIACRRDFMISRSSADHIDLTQGYNCEECKARMDYKRLMDGVLKKKDASPKNEAPRKNPVPRKSVVSPKGNITPKSNITPHKDPTLQSDVSPKSDVPSEQGSPDTPSKDYKRLLHGVLSSNNIPDPDPDYEPERANPAIASAIFAEAASVSPDESGRFQCPHCERNVKTRKDLRRHLTTHSTEKPFNCSQCGKMFGQRTGLKRHLLTHTGSKPHQCSICNQTFSGHLARHMRTHLVEKHYSCQFCEKGFQRSEHLKRHERTHLREAGEGDNDPEEAQESKPQSPPKPCPICGKLIRGRMPRHLRTHSDYKPHQCNMCEKGFLRLEHLRRHYVTHSKQERSNASEQSTATVT